MPGSPSDHFDATADTPGSAAWLTGCRWLRFYFLLWLARHLCGIASHPGRYPGRKQGLLPPRHDATFFTLSSALLPVLCSHRACSAVVALLKDWIRQSTT